MGVKVRKQVNAWAQLYWEGWEGQSYVAKVTDIGTQDIRLELDGRDIFNLEAMQQTRPIIGLLLSEELLDPQPTSLLAQVETIEVLGNAPAGAPQASAANATANLIAIELSFPESLKREQQSKIQRLVKTLK
jgi:cellulose synthase (UDP-forming)